MHVGASGLGTGCRKYDLHAYNPLTIATMYSRRSKIFGDAS